MGRKDENEAKEVAEKLTEVVQGSYEAVMESTAAAQESNARLAQSFFKGSISTLEAQTELNRRAVQGLVELAREQQEAFRALSHQSLVAYDGFLDSLFSYYKEVLSQRPEDEEDPADQR